MSSTYSPNLRLELIGTGEQQGTWGATTNTNLGTLIEEAIGGWVSVPVTDGADTTLTTANGSADQSRNMTINLTGALTATRNVICPAIEKVYIVKNATTGGFAVTFKVSGQTGVSIPNGSVYILYVNGTDASLAGGTMLAQNANNVSITGGSVTGITDLAVADGGTGASAAAGARTNLGAAASGANTDITSLTLANTGLKIADTDATHYLSVVPGSNLTANRTMTITTGDAARTLTMSGDATISGTNTGDQNLFQTIAVSGQSDVVADSTSDTLTLVAGTGITLTTNATADSVTITSTASSSGSLLRAPQILTSGTTYTTPAGCNSIYAELVGGGGAGAAGGSSGGGGGGGAGAYAAKYFSVSPSTGYTIAIGAAGADTTITVGGTTVTAGAGSAGSGRAGGAGGTATNGDINISGGDGGASATTSSGVGGLGGASYYGGGGAGGPDGNGNTGSVANAYGAGGGGGGYRSSGSNSGGAGKQGVMRIWEYS